MCSALQRTSEHCAPERRDSDSPVPSSIGSSQASWSRGVTSPKVTEQGERASTATSSRMRTFSWSTPEQVRLLFPADCCHMFSISMWGTIWWGGGVVGVVRILSLLKLICEGTDHGRVNYFHRRHGMSFTNIFSVKLLKD